MELSRCSSEMAMLRVEEMRLREEIKNSKAVCDALSISDENHLSKIESLTMQLDRLSSENRLLARRAEETSLTLSEHQQKSSDAGSVAHRYDT